MMEADPLAAVSDLGYPDSPEYDSETGSIEFVTARLARWAKISPQGMALVGFESSLARQAVIDNLQARLKEEGISFQHVALESERPAIEQIKRLAVDVLPHASGVVTVTGFQHAFTEEETMQEALRLLNYNRENLVNFPLKQIWWMPEDLATYFENTASELARYFLVWMHLTEVVRPQSSENGLTARFETLPEGPRLLPEEAEHLSHYYRERFENAVEQGRSITEVVHLCCEAFLPLLNAGLVTKASSLQNELFKKIKGRRYPIDDYLLGNQRNKPLRLDGTNFNHLATLKESQGKYFSAEQLFRMALEIYENSTEATNTDIASSLNNLALILKRQYKYEEAVPLYQKAVEITERTLGPAHPDTTTKVNNLAQLYEALGKNEEAESLYRQNLRVCEERSGPNHLSIATIMNSLAVLLLKQGNQKDAEHYQRRALNILEHVVGLFHPNTAISLNNLACILENEGNYHEAESYYKQALRIQNQLLGFTHPDIALTLSNMARMLFFLGRWEEALKQQRDAVEIYQNSLGNQHPDTQRAKKSYEMMNRTVKSRQKTSPASKPVSRNHTLGGNFTERSLQPMKISPKAKKKKRR